MVVVSLGDITLDMSPANLGLAWTLLPSTSGIGTTPILEHLLPIMMIH